MSSVEHYKILARGGVEGWNSWRSDHPSIRPNLQGANLSTRNLAGVDLSHADLSNAFLVEARLVGATLTEARLTETNLQVAVLRSARLDAATVKSAYLDRADFGEASLVGTVFADCNLAHVKNLKSVSGGETTVVGLRTLERTLASLKRHGLESEEVTRFLLEAGLSRSLLESARGPMTPVPEFYSCFVSYSHADATFAQKLYTFLRNEGVADCWLDQHRLKAGAPILDTLDKAIHEADRILVCCSQSALESFWVDRELEKALEKEERSWTADGGAEKVLIPLNLDGYLFEWKGAKASMLRDRRAPDFTEWRSADVFRQRGQEVLEALKRSVVT